MTYSDLLCVDSEDGRMNHKVHEAIFHQFNRLSSEDKTEYLSLSYLPLKFQLDKNRANTLACKMKADPLKVLQICYSNGFRNGVFPKYSKFNHSCIPNTENVWNEETSSRELRAIKSIKAGDEIMFSYIGAFCQDRNERREELYKFHFHCMCEACDISDEEVKKHTEICNQYKDLEIGCHSVDLRIQVNIFKEMYNLAKLMKTMKRITILHGPLDFGFAAACKGAMVSK